MECFAQRYCQLNPDIFTNTDTCYVLSFAIIMLNTSLHNPSVKDKPSPEQFISMNRGIDNGGDLPQELLIVSITNYIYSRDTRWGCEDNFYCIFYGHNRSFFIACDWTVLFISKF